MVEIFSEIESFFQQEQFTQEDLDALKDAIEDKYKDEHSRKLAMSAINLKLLQYQLSGPLAARVNKKIKSARTKRPNKKAATSVSKKNHLTRENVNNENNKKGTKRLTHKNIKEFLTENALNKPIGVTANYLKMPFEKFVERLNVPKDLVLIESTLFDEEMLKRNIKWIAINIKSKQKNNRNLKNKKIKKSNPRRNSAPGVYGKLATTKSIGKIIYTRMK
ncbi:hypothetical protein [Gelidibacter japonicus]|uniref:hypothetical protein n=1 Tax=Gelidibacter japonicus TaxID=1962232 RepID=UPI003A94600F